MRGNGEGEKITVSDRFKRGPWRIWRVEVEESCRLTRSKLLSISPTICRPVTMAKSEQEKTGASVRFWRCGEIETREISSSSIQIDAIPGSKVEEEQLTVLLPFEAIAMAGSGRGGREEDRIRMPGK